MHAAMNANISIGKACRLVFTVLSSPDWPVANPVEIEKLDQVCCRHHGGDILVERQHAGEQRVGLANTGFKVVDAA